MPAARHRAARKLAAFTEAEPAEIRIVVPDWREPARESK